MARPKRKPFYAQIVSKEILENNSWIVEYNNNSRVVIEYSNLVHSAAYILLYTDVSFFHRRGIILRLHSL